MQRIKNFRLTSRIVTWLLLTSIVLLIALAGIGSWLMQGVLSDQALATDHAKIETELGQTELQRAQTLETYLKENQGSIDKANSVVADTKAYQYQNQIVNDIQAYAAKAGVTITGYSFPQDTTTVKADATGLKSVPATLAVQTPVDYGAALRFFKYIEQNVTKMQITSLSLTPSPTDGNSLDAASITLKVYVR